MKEIFEILNNNFKIVKIIIENFTILDKDCSITIEIFSKDFGKKIIAFENVSGINIDSEYYSCSNRSSIIIEDLSSAQMENITYNILISEDVMAFYCKKIKVN